MGRHPHRTGLGKGSLFLLDCLLARTDREYALPTSDWRLLFLPHKESQSGSTQFGAPLFVRDEHLPVGGPHSELAN